jgi:hypothetical protein
MVDMLLGNIDRHIEWFKAHPEHKPKQTGTSFSH